jgi:hypothetical protein
VIISKLDYIPQSSDILYDADLQQFYINKPFGELTIRQYVNLTDVEYFCNKSWTLSFNFNTKSWTSFHSYIPNWYIAENNFFYSGLNGGCDLEAIAAEEVLVLDCDFGGTAIPQPSPTTTTTTTAYVPKCNFGGTAIPVI